jgi:hypothetical protein
MKMKRKDSVRLLTSSLKNHLILWKFCCAYLVHSNNYNRRILQRQVCGRWNKFYSLRLCSHLEIYSICICLHRASSQNIFLSSIPTDLELATAEVIAGMFELA